MPLRIILPEGFECSGALVALPAAAALLILPGVDGRWWSAGWRACSSAWTLIIFFNFKGSSLEGLEIERFGALSWAAGRR